MIVQIEGMMVIVIVSLSLPQSTWKQERFTVKLWVVAR
jgi:hypothetical protein